MYMHILPRLHHHLWLMVLFAHGHWTELGLIIVINLVSCAVVVKTNYGNTGWRLDAELDCLYPVEDLGSATIILGLMC